MPPPDVSCVKATNNQDTHNDDDQSPSQEYEKTVAGSTSSTVSSVDEPFKPPSLSHRLSCFRTRLVKLDDEELTQMAFDTKSSVDWKEVVLSARVGPARWRRQETEISDFAVYTRQASQRYAVLSVGLVPGCVAEIVNALQCQNSAQFTQQMEGICGDQFNEGTLVHRMDVGSLADLTARQGLCDGSELRDLTVKTVTFNKPGWFTDMEEWCYVDSLYKNPSTGSVEKYMKTIEPQEIVAGLSRSNTKYFHNVVCGYLFRPGPKDSNQQQEDDQETGKQRENVTRVTFYAEFQVAKQLGFTFVPSAMGSAAAPEKTIKQRLVKLAESTGRLTALVRRQRLGMQTLIDKKRFLPPTNTPCMVCTKILRIAKRCRLCGQGVCGTCSAKHERVTQQKGNDRLQVARIRVCANCMERVDQAMYKNLTSSSLLGSHTIPDPNNRAPSSSMLKELLRDALSNAPSPSRKASVLSVIQSLLDQESNAQGVASCENQVIQALNTLEIEPASSSDADLRSDEHRSYQLDMRLESTEALPAPIPQEEEARLVAVRRVSLSDLGELAELGILCDVAAREMRCTTSTISIIDHTTLQVIASNVEELRNLVVPRNESICCHTIMEKSAHIVPHPEADIRFSKLTSVVTYDVKYYCAFPLIGDDDQIIGAMCCINFESIEITESQFATFKKLAATANKIVRMHTNKKHGKLPRTASMGSATAI